MIKKHLLNLSTICVLAASSSMTMAHINIASENALSIGENSREYLEGSSAFLNINISHDCSNEAGEHFATTGVTVVFPNGENVSGGFTADRSGNTYGANALMGIKQRANSTFKKNIVVKGDVGNYYNHGEKSEDVRALKWLRGNVDNDHYDNLEFKAGFPKIDPASCVEKIKVFLPTVQYCKKGYKIAWINTADSKYGLGNAKTRVTDTYAAYVNVVRKTELPASCGEGETVEAMPSVEDINKLLKRRRYRH